MSLAQSGRLRVIVLLAVAAIAPSCRAGNPPDPPPRELVRKAVANEVKFADSDANFQFRSRKQTAHGSQTKLYVQTHDAMVGLVVAYDDKPLGPNQRSAELARVERFVRDPDELKKKQEQEIKPEREGECLGVHAPAAGKGRARVRRVRSCVDSVPQRLERVAPWAKGGSPPGT